MKTNANTQSNSSLHKAAQELINAAYNFWEVHQKECGPNAVVWLEDTSGHFVIFTRGEYKNAILQAAGIEIKEDIPLCDPFTVS